MSEPYRERPHDEEDDDGAVECVASHQTNIEAEMARAYLEEHAIRGVVHDSASYNPLLNVTAGGARVMVPSRDAARARSLLARLAKTQTVDEADDGEGEIRCPRCELSYCFKETTLSNRYIEAAHVAPGFALFLFPLGLFAKKRWRCHKCLYVWDDPSAGPARMTAVGPDDPRPVFRLRQRRTGTGVFLGLVLMILGMAALAAMHAPALAIPLLVLPILGGIVAHRSFTDVCSAPNCRAVLAPGAEDCRACGGSIAGVIRYRHEHFSEAAAFRRELAAVHAEEAKKLPAKKKKKKKKAAPSEA